MACLMLPTMGSSQIDPANHAMATRLSITPIIFWDRRITANNAAMMPTRQSVTASPSGIKWSG